MEPLYRSHSVHLAETDGQIQACYPVKVQLRSQTDAQVRSQHYGHQLLNWLIHYAHQQGCDQFHLDSGVQRLDAHRFYQREGLQLRGYHFVLNL